MIDLFLALLAGAVQGITEFLPISSSAHLIIFQNFSNFEVENNLTFNIALHLGTLLALILFFYKDILELIKNFILSLYQPNFKNNFQQRLPWLLVLGTIPAVIFGFLLEDLIDTYLYSSDLGIWIIALMLILIGFLFIVMEKIAIQKKEISDIKWQDSLLIGFGQALALIPGTSRSGITIIAGLTRGLKREQAARFSFLLSIPITAGVCLKKMLDIFIYGGVDWPIFSLGIASSLIVGYFVLGFLLKYLSSHSLRVFAYYRFGLAIILIFWLLFR